jgi:hypothetical protein
MPHFKCVGCKLRVQTDFGPINDVGDLCPVCGIPLAPVADLGELVGLARVEALWIDDAGSLPGVQTVALPLPGTEL